MVLLTRKEIGKMKIGLIGCGNIGQFVLNQLNKEGRVQGARIEAIYDPREDVVKQLAQEYATKAYLDYQAFIESEIDLVIEAAHPNVVREYAPSIIEQGKNLLIISVGALVGLGPDQTKVKI